MQASCVKIETTKELLKKTLKANRLCCCAPDGSFQCKNCAMVDDMQAPREWACPNCMGMA